MIEISSKRSANAKHFDNADGSFTAHSHVGHIHYFNKLGAGDGQVRWREVDWSLSFDEVKRGWSFKFHSFNPFLPEYADGSVEFRDLFDEKDQTIKYRAQCEHVKGELLTQDLLEAEGLSKLTQQNCVIYRDAFGEGKDYILYFTRSTLAKVVRIRDGFKGNTDLTFDFQVQFPKKGAKFMKVKRGVNKDNIAYELDITTPKTFDSDKQLLIGNDQNGGKEWNTYMRPFYVWDSGETKKQATINVNFYLKDGKKYFRKIVPGSFLESSSGDVFTDTTTSYYSGAGDGWCSGFDLTTWATARGLTSANNGTNYVDSTNTYFQTYKTGAVYIIMRQFYPADTSGIGSTNAVSSATFNFWAINRTANTDSVSWHLVETSQASTSSLVNDDYDNFVNTGLGSIAISGTALGAYNAVTLTDLTKINTVGTTKLGFISSLDLNNTAPTGTNYFDSYMSENSGTTNDPYYSITYVPKMAIAYDASSKNADTWTTSATSMTWIHTVGGAPNTALVVTIGTYDSGAGDKCTGVTFNGTAMTKVDGIAGAVESTNQYLSAWILFAPSSGTANIVASFSETINNMFGFGESFSGVSQSGADGHATATGTGSPATVSITTSADNCWLVGTDWSRGALVPTASTNTTNRQTNAGVGCAIGDTNSAQTPAGSKSLAWTHDTSSSYTWWGIAVSLAPYVATSPSASTLSMMGVG